VKYYFFDVYDTLVLRSWSRPTDLFLEVAQQLRSCGLIEVLEETFVTLRMNAELSSREKVQHGEILIYEIYENLSEEFNWEKEQIERAISIEIESELGCVYPNTELLLKINAARDNDFHIAYVSDMYLPSETIKSVLQKVGYWNDGDLLFVSGEIKKNKATGELFNHLIRELQPTEIRHIGDNHTSDYIVPNSIGIKAEWYIKGHNNRYESSELSYPTAKQNILKSKLEAISKINRLSQKSESENETTIWQTGSNIIGHLFTSFVLWTLFEAEQKKIKTLYFIARDGQILKKIADTILAKWNFKVECKYIYASRQAFHFPAIQNLDEEDMDWIFDPTDFLSIKVLFERVNLLPEDVSDVLIDNGFLRDSWSRNLSYSERDRLKKVFLSKRIKELIISKASEYRKLALGYLQQEGVLENDIAIVDLGWRGRLQKSLIKLLHSGNCISEPIGFYFKLFNNDNLSCKNMFSFLDNLDIEIQMRDDFLSVMNLALIESFAYADHGSTIKYDYEKEYFLPILREGNVQQAKQWGIDVQHNSVVSYTDMIVSHFKKDYTLVSKMLEIGLRNYMLFYKKPTQNEASIYGQFKMSEHQTEAEFNSLAPIYNLKDIFNLLWNNKRKWHNEWDQAVEIRNGKLFSHLTNDRMKNIIQKIKNKIIT
jgi:predicted HAD superfamily hydrolase